MRIVSLKNTSNKHLYNDNDEAPMKTQVAI